MVSVEKVSDSETRLVVTGSMFGEAAVEFEKNLESLVGTMFHTITLDLSMATGITSASIGKVVSTHRRLNAESRRIRIVGCSETLFRLFTMMKLDQLIPISRGGEPAKGG